MLRCKKMTLSFVFKGTVSVKMKKNGSDVNSAFGAARSKLQKYIVDGAQPAVKFLEQV